MADNTLPQGVIFDMDGVLIDSEEYICKQLVGCLKSLDWKFTPKTLFLLLEQQKNASQVRARWAALDTLKKKRLQWLEKQRAKEDVKNQGES